MASHCDQGFVQLDSIHFWQIDVEDETSVGFWNICSENQSWPIESDNLEAVSTHSSRKCPEHRDIVVDYENGPTWCFPQFWQTKTLSFADVISS